MLQVKTQTNIISHPVAMLKKLKAKIRLLSTPNHKQKSADINLARDAIHNCMTAVRDLNEN